MADSVADLPAGRGEGVVAHREGGPDRARPDHGAPYRGRARPDPSGRAGADPSGRAGADPGAAYGGQARPTPTGRNGADRTGWPGTPRYDADRADRGTAPYRPTARRPASAGPRPVPWLVLSIVVAVLAFGLLSLRSVGLDLLGGRGLAAVFVLGEALGIGGIVFVARGMAMAGRDPGGAAESLRTGRRWALSGLAFVVGMGLVALGAQFLPTAMTS